MSVSELLGGLRSSIKRRGINDTVRRAFFKVSRRFADSRFDRVHRVDTSGIVELDELEIDSDSKDRGIWYEPMSTKSFLEIIARIKIDCEKFIFLDIGAGKGKVLFLAARQPFKKAIGIEFSNELCIAAQHNIERFRDSRQRCFDIEVLAEDATEYEFPQENLVLFFYSPFRDAELMNRLLANLRKVWENGKSVLLVFHGKNIGVMDTLKASGLHQKELHLSRDLARSVHYDTLLLSNDGDLLENIP